MNDGAQSPAARDPNVEDPAEVEDDPSSTLLDLTSCQLHDLDSVDLPPYLTKLDLTTNRLSALDPRIAHLSNLKKLSLRQNLLTDAAVEPLSTWHDIARLEELVRRDDQLKKKFLMPAYLRNYWFFMFLTSLNGWCRVSNTLKELSVSRNEVMKMEEIDHFHELQILELGSNKLRNLTNLQELWLGRNRIKAVNLCGLTCIKKISLQSNRLTSMAGFEVFSSMLFSL
ncbi:protein phosphatase 1 regulatory inhibitor subunit PPP1R7 homolog [Neltuma alba]|uniref:protein phosphatase 1 regulatory inhibitor subunit PPP1R7 homolog n=1 Tax=Neltuma alba TaxID=207710 RepID=UPI0010A3B79D|nr:protein phosphatase 1 regulatory inhibitor subunit PPP1R7 homolog [Prosopis alba]